MDNGLGALYESFDLPATILSDLAAGKFVEICNDVYLFDDFEEPLIGSQCIIEESINHVEDIFEITVPPLFIVVSNSNVSTVPPYVTYIVGEYGCIYLNQSDLVRKEVLVHEITHCSISTGHRFFDEGLSTYAERVLDTKDWDFSVQVRREPYKKLFSSKHWTPYFDEFPANYRAKLYEIAARLISTMVCNGGVGQLKRFLIEVKLIEDANVIGEIFEKLFNIMIVDLDEKLNLTGNELENLLTRVGEGNSIVELFRVVTNDFILGETINASQIYTDLQACSVESADEEILCELASLRALTLVAFDGDEPDPRAVKKWKKEALYFISENDGQLDSFLLQLHFLLSDLYQSIDRPTVLEKINTLLDIALALYPSSIELYVFKFKLLINDPRKQQVEAMSILDGFKNDSVYGSAVVHVLNTVGERNVSGT